LSFGAWQTTRKDHMATPKPIPVIDLFAGPGGLGEGFSSLSAPDGSPRFKLRVSIEKDPHAHRTLSLRALFRQFSKEKAPDCYYDRIRGDISQEALFAHPDAREAGEEALNEARHAELGTKAHEEIDARIAAALGDESDWVLIGGPPCQAYSLAGRSRRTKENQEKFESDEKHFLYKEYLRIIRRFKPAVFVMENVKGMLSSTHGGSGIFERIMADLSSPGEGLSYGIRSLAVPGETEELNPKDFIIEAERFGIPQCRHRVILFGVRSDVAARTPELSLHPERFTIPFSPVPVSVAEALSGLPRLRSCLSRRSKTADSHEAWLDILRGAPAAMGEWSGAASQVFSTNLENAIAEAGSSVSPGGAFIAQDAAANGPAGRLHDWFFDPRLGGVIQHDTRSHMHSDLHRYLFASCYAKTFGVSPKVTQFPRGLLPAHENATDDHPPFSDRFRVQLASSPSSTVVAHIAKDGHYFIHPDPSQCRSLTVREAARLQTFPDNYFFEGNRTQQYTQVGNAVPPLLARKIALVVLDFMRLSSRRQATPR
jgi:DNA (cytosine-5)-methyltransferase 1